MIEHIRHRLDKLKPGSSLDEMKRALTSIYDELEGRGFSREEVFALINIVVCDNIRRLRTKLLQGTK